MNSITLKTPAVIDNQVLTKAYVDQFHREIERFRRALGISFYDESNDLTESYQDNDFNDEKLTNLVSIRVNRTPTSDNEITEKKYGDDLIEESTILKFIHTLQKYLKVSVGNDVYNLIKFNKIQITDTTFIKYPNTGGYLLQNWV